MKDGAEKTESEAEAAHAVLQEVDRSRDDLLVCCAAFLCARCIPEPTVRDGDGQDH